MLLLLTKVYKRSGRDIENHEYDQDIQDKLNGLRQKSFNQALGFACLFLIGILLAHHFAPFFLLLFNELFGPW